MLRSEWLGGARPAGRVAPNGGGSVSVLRLARECVKRFGCDEWALRVLYEPLEMLRSHPLRREKYFLATVLTVQLMEGAFGVSAGRTGHLHRHALLACYLDALVDSSDSLDWPLAFGMAVFGMAPAPAFEDGHPEALREALRRDYPRLRLAAAGEHRDLIVGSLLRAARVETQRRLVPHREYKLLSNLVCIQPFAMGAEALAAGLMEPLAMVFTFIDDAMDVLEDLDAGVETHMGTEEGVRSAAGLARTALSELNAAAGSAGGGDWSSVAEAVVAAGEWVATAQIRHPALYREASAGLEPLLVRLAATFFALYAIPACTRSPSLSAPARRTT